MVYLIIVLLAVIFVNVFLFYLQTKIIKPEDSERLKKILEEFKKGNVEILEKEEKFMMEITNKQMKIMLLSFLIIIITFFLLKEIIGDNIVIPLPFNNPITGKPGLGWLGSYIVLSSIVGIPLRKVLNKIFIESSHGLEGSEKKNSGRKNDNNTQKEKRKSS